MKLKKLLEETAREDKAVELYELFQSGKYLLTPKKIYRGMSTPVDTYIHRSVRKGRKPKATTKVADTFVNEFIENFFPSHPSRRRSSFGTPSPNFASSFGQNVNMMVPKKSAKVRFYEHDTWPKYTSTIGNKINAGVRKLNNLNTSLGKDTLGQRFEEIRENFDEDIIDFIYGIWEMKTYGDNGIFEDVITQFPRFLDLLSKLRFFTKTEKVKEKLANEIVFAAGKFLAALNKFKSYVNDSHEEYHSNTREVIIEGDHIIINPKWFDEFFEWNTGNVKFKGDI